MSPRTGVSLGLGVAAGTLGLGIFLAARFGPGASAQGPTTAAPVAATVVEKPAAPAPLPVVAPPPPEPAFVPEPLKFGPDGLARIGSAVFADKPPAGAAGPSLPVSLPGRPNPTNDWWTSVLVKKPSDAHHAHPLAFQARPDGLLVGRPPPHVFPDGKTYAAHLGSGDLVLAPEGAGAEGAVEGWSDWFVTVRVGDAARGLRCTYGHGSPYVFVDTPADAAAVRFVHPPAVWHEDAAAGVFGVAVEDRDYLLCLLPGSALERAGERWTLRLGARGWFTLAALPPGPEGRAAWPRLAARAHNHVRDSRVAWRYDEAAAEAVATFAVTTEARAPGAPAGTVLLLYPHQWRALSDGAVAAGIAYPSVRGALRAVEGERFVTRTPFRGVLPFLPPAPLSAEARAELVAFRPPPELADTYWGGKVLGKLAALVTLAGQAGEPEAEARLLAELRARLENWFDARDLAGPPGPMRAGFVHDAGWGALVGYPASYGSETEFNDHHFHHGYFIRAAAEVARRDPVWGRAWGGAVRALVRDIAAPTRDDPDFPFLRNFDPYAGHSWASGFARFADGNNQESTSEAMAAWTGLVLWGEATGDRAIRDLGVWLHATERAALEEYWFNAHGAAFPEGFKPAVAGIVWGGGTTYATWFSGRPEHIHGINWLPFHGGSLYLGQFPGLAAGQFDALDRSLAAAGDARPADWEDLVLMYRALSDPADALARRARAGAGLRREPAVSSAQFEQWLQVFARHGTPDGSVAADTPLHAVLAKDGRRTRLVYNSGRETRRVRFTDGVILDAPPGVLTVAPDPAP